MWCFDSIPLDLQNEPIWLGARIEDREGRPTKVPYCSFSPSRKASTTNPATWSDFATARRAVEAGRLPLLGFVIRPPYVGIDLDHCRDVQTGAIEPWAEEIIAMLDSYTETSISGTGVHIIVRGTLPPSGRRKGPIELYDRDRFFVMTGLSL